MMKQEKYQQDKSKYKSKIKVKYKSILRMNLDLMEFILEMICLKNKVWGI